MPVPARCDSERDDAQVRERKNGEMSSGLLALGEGGREEGGDFSGNIVWPVVSRTGCCTPGDAQGILVLEQHLYMADK